MYIIPEPQEMNQKEGSFTVCFDQKIVLDTSCSPESYGYARLIQEEFKTYTGYGPAISRGRSKKTAITLAITPGLLEEEYRLKVDGDGIRIESGGDKGLLYGVQTLRQIVRQSGACIPYVDIHDFPGIKNRGFYHDVTRGRIPTLSYLKKLADKMAFYKLNQLQLYIEHSFLFEDLSEVWRDDTPLTAQDFLELDAYCRKLNIDLVPNISCFGHLYKVLRTKSYGQLCELPEPLKEPFSFYDRMAHHTIDVTNRESILLVKSLIEEYMPLFTSEYFNVGADETFDLGKGRSRETAEKEGVQRLYIDYVREICEFVVSKGKKPMFWGDIICGFPESIKELPPTTICLNWGYSADVGEESTRKLSQAGAVQYNCPGVNGWNEFVGRLDVAYENIRRMCSYAYKYQSEGVLTTDWGDYGHINHPDLSIPGMIYGAAFSWKKEAPDFEEMNRRISRVEFGDRSERLVSLIAQISHNQTFGWRQAVCYKEHRGEEAALSPELAAGTGEVLQELGRIAGKLRELTPGLPEETNAVIHACLVAMKGMELIQKAGALILAKDHHTKPVILVDACKLSSELEEWFMFYKEVWRSVSRESELSCIQDVIFWYADLLRDCSEITLK